MRESERGDFTYDSIQLGGPLDRHRGGVEASADAVKAIRFAYRVDVEELTCCLMLSWK
jgi:hypothetical protein